MHDTVDCETSAALEHLIVAGVIDHVRWRAVKVEVSKGGEHFGAWSRSGNIAFGIS